MMKICGHPDFVTLNGPPFVARKNTDDALPHRGSPPREENVRRLPCGDFSSCGLLKNRFVFHDADSSGVTSPITFPR